MLQIIIWLGAVYLVFQGQEILMIAASSSHENRGKNIERAKNWRIAAFVLAGVFVLLSFFQGSAFPSPEGY